MEKKIDWWMLVNFSSMPSGKHVQYCLFVFFSILSIANLLHVTCLHLHGLPRTGKVGGAKSLSANQAATLERQQIAEFKKRYKSRPQPSGRLPGNYAGRSSDSRAELVLCLDSRGECVGCAGVEG